MRFVTLRHTLKVWLKLETLWLKVLLHGRGLGFYESQIVPIVSDDFLGDFEFAEQIT